MARVALSTLCALLVTFMGVNLGLVPQLLAAESNQVMVGNEGHGEQEKGPTLRLLRASVGFPDEDASTLPVHVAGLQEEVLGDGPYYVVPLMPSDRTMAGPSHRLPIQLLSDDLLSALRGKRGDRGRRGRVVRVYDRATRRWYRYFIPSLSMNNVFGQFRPSRRTRGGPHDAEPGTDYGQGTETEQEGGSRAWWKDADGETGSFEARGYY
ncbi:uncharacterized protein LOC144875493 [Branchiostoma floridae x Branchiostoma japonicum]